MHSAEVDQNADRERRLDEAVLAYLKARENDPQLDPQAWADRYPELKVDLGAFFGGQERIDRVAGVLRLMCKPEGTLPYDGTTVAYASVDPSRPSTNTDSSRAFGDYEILEEIGKGGMGRVYRARQVSLKRIVALKMILAGAYAGPEELHRFRCEAEAVARLQHPNIVQIFEVGETEGTAFFSLEFVSGGSLASQLDGTPVPPRAAAALVRTIAGAIQFAHEHGIIHRDLKPANVLLGSPLAPAGKETHRPAAASTAKPGRLPTAPRLVGAAAKVTDFGLAKRLDDESGQTKSGAIMGTPSYMAPEQAAGQGSHVGPAADVYGLGAVLYELLTGRPPFRAATPWETVYQVLHQEPASPRLLDAAIDRDVETICLRCLHKEPAARYESAQALADDLGRYLDGRPILARPVSGAVKFWRMCRRHPATAASLAFALLTLFALLATAVVFNGRLKRELAQNEAINRDLQMSLTRQVADRIDGNLRQLTRPPTLLAAALSKRTDWREEELEGLMRQMLEDDERLFGMAVALEPRRFDGKREDFALYVYRGPDGIRSKMLLLPHYQPLYREHRWYADVKEHRVSCWSEPFYDQEGGNIPMLTYSAPILRDGMFAGVVTADLSVGYFDAMRRWLDEVNFGGDGYAFVLSPTGTFISHPDARFKMPLKVTEAPGIRDEPHLQTLASRLLKREAGFARANDPTTGKPSVFYFAPIASAHWSFVAVVEE